MHHGLQRLCAQWERPEWSAVRNKWSCCRVGCQAAAITFQSLEKCGCANGRHAVIRKVQKYSCNTASKLNGGKSFTSLGQLRSAGSFTDGHRYVCGCVNRHALNTPFLNRYVRVKVTAKLSRAWVEVKFAPGICFGSLPWVLGKASLSKALPVAAFGGSESSAVFFCKATCTQRLPLGG